MVSLCFPGSAQVYLGSGESRLIGSLEPNEELLTLALDKSTGRVKRSSLFTYLHYEPKTSAQFLVFTCENQRELTISESHLLFVRKGDGKAAQPTMAKNVAIGDSLLHVGEDKEIRQVQVVGIEEKVCTGVFAPLTKSGTLIVDGFLVSCYAHVESHAKAHVSLAPLRLWLRLSSNIGKGATSTKGPKNGIHKYAKTLASIYGLST